MSFLLDRPWPFPADIACCIIGIDFKIPISCLKSWMCCSCWASFSFCAFMALTIIPKWSTTLSSICFTWSFLFTSSLHPNSSSKHGTSCSGHLYLKWLDRFDLRYVLSQEWHLTIVAGQSLSRWIVIWLRGIPVCLHDPHSTGYSPQTWWCSPNSQFSTFILQNMHCVSWYGHDFVWSSKSIKAPICLIINHIESELQNRKSQKATKYHIFDSWYPFTGSTATRFMSFIRSEIT